ncbi:hypothetical protein DXG03_009152 [Asterophora parasitica]|uniref:Protein FAF1 n=1 Tax=Asterophora parasitica TaxID=117018 RepID=A0A9P7GB98_9AGAR|nr:hypothetical protein DXG03_009152 [Asterophora parasitica]
MTQNLLDILQAHGQQFLNSFALPESGPNKRKRAETAPSPRKSPKIVPENDSEEEWGGIAEDAEHDNESSRSESEGPDDFEQEDDEFTAGSSSNAIDSKIVVFQDLSYGSSKKSDPASKAQMKAFMSSKVSKLREDVPGAPAKEKTDEEKEDDRTNAQNDAILHRLVHTKLLSGSLDPDLDMTPAKRRKALAGRVLELSGAAKIGRGEKSVREKERNNASKRVREGLLDKQKQRAKAELEEAKELGNYHPTLKKVFDSDEGPSTRKRERGLKMGVGKFQGGLLKLSRDEIMMAEGGGRGRGRGGSRGSRGGGRGLGRGRGR